MFNEYDESKLFSNELDRLLSGQEITLKDEESREILTALDFAKKMSALRSEPSYQFKSHLKASLLQKLNNQEGNRSWFGKIFKEQPTWITTIVCAALLIIVGGVLWRTGIVSPPQINWFSSLPKTPVATTTATTTSQTSTIMYLFADASVDKPAYETGEIVYIEVDLTNASGLPFTLTQYPPILSLMSSDTKQAVYTFTAGQKSQTIPPGQKTSFTLSWNQVDTQGRLVKSGNYYIELEDLDLQGKAVKLNLNKPVEFEILPYY